ncbi:MAG: glycosyltransferase [Planctomycetaceae bacterium]
MNTPPAVTIVICCYNSARRLPETLRHVGRQARPADAPIELVIVDNCCTDATVALARQWSDEHAPSHLKVRIVSENRPGLTWARACGIRAAESETVILCDDDNWLEEDYSSRAFEILAQHPDVGLAGGCSLAVPELTPPHWFDSISGAWAVGSSDYVGYLEGPDAFLRGAGLVVRRSVYLRLLETGCAFLTSDRRGSSLSSGGDLEISREFQRLGARLYFDARLTLRHWIPRERLTREYALRLWKGFGAGTIASDADRVAGHPQQSFRNFVRCSWLYQVVRGALGLTRQLRCHPWFHPNDPRPSLAFCSLLGRVSEIWELGANYGTAVISKAKYILDQQHKQ